MSMPNVKSLMMPALVAAIAIWVAIAQYLQTERLGALAARLDRLSSERGGATRPLPIPSEPVALSKTSTLGRVGAAVGIIEYADFECPFCRTFARTVLPEIQRRYIDTGKVLMSFKHLPLERIHPNARGAAVAAECAGLQGKFWQMHDILFANPRGLSLVALPLQAKSIGLDERAFDQCVEGPVPARVLEQVDEARRLLISGTPAILLGRLDKDGRVRVTSRLAGAQRFERFESILDRLLSQTR